MAKNVQVPRSLEELLVDLASYCDETAIEAARSLGQLKDPRAVEPLIRSLGRGSSSPAALTGLASTVGRSAAYALGAIGDVRAITPLIECLGTSDMWLTLAAGSALEKFGDMAVDPLLAALQGPNAHARAEAASVLGRHSDKTALPPARSRAPLIAALKDPDWVVRRRAAESLGKFRDPELAPLLAALMEDENEEVRRGALAGLRLLGGPVAKQALARYDKKWWQFWKRG